ncbi:hypothetical protein FDECE_7264 [Fusarium decemcellulare]|nr:hypothetical protein FDECE_7264 [Fusarium decemcellulare]
MMSPQLLTACAVFSLLVGSGASPCRPSSSLSDTATTTSLSVIETSSTAIDATSSTETLSTDVTTIAVVTSTESETLKTSATEVSTTTDLPSTTEATSTTTSAAAAETPALRNGGFDVTPASYDPWTIYSGLAASISLDDSKVQAGSYSLSMRSAASDSVVVVQILDKTHLVANQIYTFSLYAQVSSAARCSDGLSIWIDDNNMQHAVGASVHANAADMEGTWKYIEGDYTFTEAAITGSNDIRVVVKSRCGNGYFASIDSAKLALKQE